MCRGYFQTQVCCCKRCFRSILVPNVTHIFHCFSIPPFPHHCAVLSWGSSTWVLPTERNAEGCPTTCLCFPGNDSRGRTFLCLPHACAHTLFFLKVLVPLLFLYSPLKPQDLGRAGACQPQVLDYQPRGRSLAPSAHSSHLLVVTGLPLSPEVASPSSVSLHCLIQ